MEKNILHVVDMSPCIYAGSYNKRSFIQGDVINTVNGYRERNIPTGGTSMLFNIIGQYLSTGPIAFVADRNPTIKKEKHPEYKASRTHPTDVSISKEVAEYILSDCGFDIYAKDGYEADDIIYSIVRKNRSKYDHIFVHTADSDLYFLVSEKVSILPTSTKAKLVTLENYTYVCRKGSITPYNTVMFEKFLHGDSSKGVHALSKQDREELTSVFYRKELLEFLGSPEDMRMIMRKRFPQHADRLSLFYPIFVDDKYDVEFRGNKQRIQEWAYAIGNRKVVQRRGDLSKQIREMLDMSLYIE